MPDKDICIGPTLAIINSNGFLILFKKLVVPGK